MTIKVNITGTDELSKALNAVKDLSPVKQLIKVNTAELQREMHRKVPVQTGNLKRSLIMNIRDSGFTGEITSNVEYGPYVEYGTFKRAPKPFIRPAINVVSPKFKSDIERFIKM